MAPSEARPEPAEEEPLDEAPAAASLFSGRGVALAGRSLVVLGGAYLLRALTDGGALSPGVGAGLGLLYAVAMLVLSHRAAAAAHRDSAGFHGLTGVAIALPLIGETTTRLHILEPAGGAGALVGFLALAVVVAWRHGLRLVGWPAVLGAIAVGFVLLVGTPRMMPAIAALFAVAAACEALAFDERWHGLRWPAAVALDVALLHLAGIAVRAAPPEGFAPLPTGAVLAALLGLPVLYLASVATRTIVRGGVVAVFGIGQSVAALLVGLSGAGRVLAFHDRSLAWVGIPALVLGAACYAIAFYRAERRAERNVHFYASLGGLLALGGAAGMLSEGALATAWSVLAVAATVAGARARIAMLRWHGAIYAVAAAAAGGLLGAATDGLLGDPAGEWRAVGAGAVVALVGAAACWSILSWWRDGADPVVQVVPRAFVAAALGWSAIGLAARVCAGIVAAAPGPGADAGFAAVARTGVLAVAAILLAWSGRRFALRELRWLAYPVLVGGAIKMLAEDFPSGRPASLFLTLALYGGALALAPRFLRKD